MDGYKIGELGLASGVADATPYGQVITTASSAANIGRDQAKSYADDLAFGL